jgi:hypothetical protein
VRSGLTLIVPYYRNVAMLAQQLKEWKDYPEGVEIVVVDDGSPEPASDVLKASDRAKLYRVIPDIPWNRGGARNLGAHVAETKWLMHIDIDHILPAAAACRMFDRHFPPDDNRWYRFRRWRVGKADATRRKDAIRDDISFGEVRPHGDSYLCTRELYWRVGGYNENFSGCLGGGSPFLQEMEREAPVALFHSDVMLHVHTRDSVKDASDWSLSRDTSEYSRRRKEMERTGTIRGTNPLRFEWERVL